MTKLYDKEDISKKRTNRLIDGLINNVMILTAFLLFAITQVQAASVIYEAEDAVISGPSIASNHSGYSGTGFVDYQNDNNDYIEWTVDADSAGQYLINFRYALGNTDRPLEIRVNGQIVAASQSFPGTGGWTNWGTTVDLSVNLNQGSNTIRATAIGSSGANVDYLEVTGDSVPVPVPDLSITKDSNKSGDILPGETFTYTIVIENDATATANATNVTVRDPLPAGVTYVSGTAEKTYYSDDGNTGSFSQNMGTVSYGNNGNGTTQTFTVTTANSNIPTGAVLTSYQLTTAGSAIGGAGDDGWLEDVGVTAFTPGGATAYTLAPGHFGGVGTGDWDIVEPLTTSIATQLALGDYSLEWITAWPTPGGDYYIVDNATFTIEWTGRGITTDAAYDPSPDPAPSFMVTAADNITLKPGETLTVTFQVKADDDLSSISSITNTAYTASTETPTEISASTSNTALPVTITYAYPQRYGNTIDLDFGTATETGNLGFNVYAVKGKGKKKKWIKLNEELIPGALDSFEPQDYHASVEIPEGLKVKKIGIVGVDISGKEDRHGSFKIGKESGEKSVSVPVDWEKVQREVKKERKARKAAKKEKRQAKKATRTIFEEDLVTLNVKEKAVYKITHDDLLSQGVDLRGFKVKQIAISLKDEGIARHIAGVNKKGKWTKESSIEFIGERPDITDALYVDTNKYRLSLNKKLAVENEAIESLTQKEIVIDHNNRYAYTMPLNDPFYEEYFYTLNASESKTYTSTFDMPVVPKEGTSHLSIHSAVSTKGSHKMAVILNGIPVADTSAKDKGPWIVDTEIDNSIFQQSNNELTFTLYGEDDGMDIVAYDKLIISYDDSEAIPSQTPEIELNDKVTKKDIRVKQGTDYLVISHPLFINETLDNYVQTREGEGWKIQVINVEDIYAAYSNNMAIPEAIKAYIQDAGKRGITHLQFIGASSHDNLDHLGSGSMSFIPILYTLTNDYIHYTPSDASYVLGEDELPVMAIGRWPVHTLEEFENIINKTLAYQSDINEALLITDQVDNKGTDFKPQMNLMANLMEENGYHSKKVYLDILNEEDEESAVSKARDEIQQSMLDGISILSYNGHGAPTRWSPQGLIKQEDIASIDNAQSAPIMLPFTCMATYADSPSSNTMAHQLLSANQSGAVAVYGASIYSSYADNGKMIGKVFKNLNKGQTLGEAIQNTKHELGANYRDVIRNGDLLGDVSLKVRQ